MMNEERLQVAMGSFFIFATNLFAKSNIFFEKQH